MDRSTSSPSPFSVHSLNHDEKLPSHRPSRSNPDTTPCIDPLDKDPKRRCNCLNHRKRRGQSSPKVPKKEAPSAISRMYGRSRPDEGFWREDGWTYSPSTPGSSRRRSSGNLPSTTPAGRPLWSNRTTRSTTPSGPPPASRSLFGSSRVPSRNTPSPGFRFGRPGPTPSSQKGRTMSTFVSGSRGRGRSYIPTRSQSARSYYSDAPSDAPSEALASSPPPGSDPFYDDPGYFDQQHYHRHDHYYDELDQDEMDEDYRHGYHHPEEMDEDEEMREEDEDETMIDNSGPKPPSRKSSRPTSVKGSVRGTPANRSRASTMRSPVRPAPQTHLGPSGTRYDIGSIAKSIAADFAARPLTSLLEPDELVRETERILYALGESDATEHALSAAVKQLCILWNHPHKPTPNVIGPDDEDSPLAKADFIASLLLQIHHPPPFEHEKQNLQLSRRGQMSAFSQSFARQYAIGQTPLPKVLVDWLNARHDPSAAEFELLQRMLGGYSKHPGFWDVIFSCVMRGSFNDAIHFLREGNFSLADSALEDGHAQPGYTGIELTNVNKAIGQAVEVLQCCPAYNNDDWDVKGMDWTLYRRTVADAVDDLRLFAEGERAFANDEFALSTQDDGAYNFSTASRRAESRVPYTVYENLQILYSLLLGNEEEIIGVSFDWVEATVCLTAWWDGEDEEQLLRAGTKRPRQTRVADVTPGRAYRKRFAYSLARVMAEEDPGLTINSNNPVEIALACVMEENMDGLIPIMRGWSLTITAAIIEIASAGGWLGDSVASRNLLRGFDESDLMVLSFGQGDKLGFNKDEILQQYSELLFSKPKIKNTEGWELAIQVLGRLDNAEAAKNKISELLDRLPLSSAERVDKILNVCNSLGLIEHANTIAERYAAFLAENSYNYGSALFYYARAHNPGKIRDVLDLLISLCLIHSTAYPAQADLDERLRALINTPKQTLSTLARSDLEAAQMLSMYLSGYATLRKFYDLRDEEVHLPDSKKPPHRPLERKRLAAQALVAVINSAADSIRGGLYDPDVDSAVQVDGLLTLLGEALPFVTHPKRLFSASDLAVLMRAAEDLQTAPSLVYAQCEEHLQAALAHAHGSAGTGASSGNMEPPRSLKKSISNLTASSYSFVGSASGVLPSSTEGSGILVGESGSLSKDAKRGWDWRRGLQRGAKGNDVCGFLRVRAAQDLARAWADGE